MASITSLNKFFSLAIEIKGYSLSNIRYGTIGNTYNPLQLIDVYYNNR